MARQFAALLVLTQALGLAPGTGSAQDSLPARGCGSGRPAVECRSFHLHIGAMMPLAQFSLAGPKAGTSGLDPAIRIEAGFLSPRPGGTALGASVWWFAPDATIGASFKYRRWVRPGVALDLAPGLSLVGRDLSRRLFRPTVDVEVTLREWLGVSIRGELDRLVVGADPNAIRANTRLKLWGGAHVGTKAAPVGIIALLGAVAAALASCSSGCGGW